MEIFDFQRLILEPFIQKHSLIKKSWLDFFTESTALIIGSFHLEKVYLFSNRGVDSFLNPEGGGAGSSVRGIICPLV